MRGAPAPFLWFPGAHAAGAALARVHEVAAHSQHPWVPRLPWPCSDPAGGGGCAPGNMGITPGSSRALEAFVVCLFVFFSRCLISLLLLVVFPSLKDAPQHFCGQAGWLLVESWVCSAEGKVSLRAALSVPKWREARLPAPAAFMVTAPCPAQLLRPCPSQC